MPQFDVCRRVEFDPETTAPSVAVVEAIAAVENVDPAVLFAADGTKLQDYIDGDALDRILTGAEGGAAVSFAVRGCGVQVRSDGVLTVRTAPGADRRAAETAQHEQ